MNPIHRTTSPHRRTLPAMLLTLALVMLAFGGGAGQAGTQATIVVNTRAKMHPLNRFIFGQNILFASNSLWNTRVNDVDPAVRPLVKELAPSILRFPGGTASNIYLWEDGLGFRTTKEIKPFTSTISLNGAPNWKAVRRARIFDSRAGTFGEPFIFRNQNGSLLEGVVGVKKLYPRGHHPPGREARTAGLFHEQLWHGGTYETSFLHGRSSDHHR